MIAISVCSAVVRTHGPMQPSNAEEFLSILLNITKLTFIAAVPLELDLEL
jgi:hypothetical protein